MRLNSGSMLFILLALLIVLQCVFIITPVDRALLSYLGDLKQEDGKVLVYGQGSTLNYLL